MDEVAKKSLVLPEVPVKHCLNTLLLDLDDTLIHTMDSSIDYSKVNINYKDVKQTTYMDKRTNSLISIKTILRPYAQEFLKEMRGFFEIVVTTHPRLLRYSQQDRRSTHSR